MLQSMGSQRVRHDLLTEQHNRLKLCKPTEFFVIGGITETEADSTEHKSLEKVMQFSGMTG